MKKDPLFELERHGVAVSANFLKKIITSKVEDEDFVCMMGLV